MIRGHVEAKIVIDLEINTCKKSDYVKRLHKIGTLRLLHVKKILVVIIRS